MPPGAPQCAGSGERFGSGCFHSVNQSRILWTSNFMYAYYKPLLKTAVRIRDHPGVCTQYGPNVLLYSERKRHCHWNSHHARWLGIIIRNQHSRVSRVFIGPSTWLHTTLSWCVVGEWDLLRDVVLDDRGGGGAYDETVQECMYELISERMVTPRLKTLVCHTGPTGGVLVGPALKALVRRHGWFRRTGDHADVTVRIEWSGGSVGVSTGSV